MKKKYIFHSILFLLLFPLLALKSDANTLYWVGNGGNWNDASHWSAVSGGNGGAGIPVSTTDVVFDRNSFTFPNETVTITGAASCHNMQWTDDVYFPVVSGATSSSFSISGSFGIAINMLWQFNGTINFTSSINNTVISTYGRTLPGNVNFNGDGSWQLDGFLMLSKSSTLILTKGTLAANGNVIQCGTLKIQGNTAKVLDISNSILFINKNIDSSAASNFSTNTVNALIYYQNYTSVSSFSALNNKLIPPKTPAISNFDTIVVRPSCNCNDTDGTNGKGKCCNGKVVIDSVTSFDSSATFGYKWSTGATVDSVTGVCASLGTISCTITDSSDLSHKTVIINVSIPQLNIPNEVPKPPRCNGDCNGWIITDISGGTPTYSYKWSSGVPGSGSGILANKNFIDSSLCAGTYTLTVTDAHSCKNTFVFPLSQPKVVSVTLTSTNVLCNSACNGTASVATTTGGHGSPYTYTWSNGKTTTSISGLCPGTYTVTAQDDSGCIGTAAVTITQPTPIVMNPSQTNVDCSGNCDGTASVSPTGGTPAYTYLWSNGKTTSTITGLCAGAYKVVLTDANGCKDSASFTITQPTTLSASLSKTNIDCNGNCDGTASVTASGGTPAYTYKWSTGATTTNITGLCASPPTYWVKVTDAHNCVDSISFTITQPPPLVANQVTYNIDCNGKCDGSAAVHPTGGTSPYTYLWYPSGNTTDSISKLCAGNYTVVITDKNKCKDSLVLTITQPPAITILITSNNVSCNGSCNGSATANVSGGTGAYTYSWSPGGQTTSGITGLCAGSYTVHVTDANGCSASASVIITQPNPLSLSLTASPNPLKCNGDKTATISSSVSGGTAPYTYKWSPGGQTTPVITNQGAGTYKLVVTDANGCKDSATITINQPPQLRDSITASTNIKCNGSNNGSATVGVKGGTPGYTYVWSPSGGTNPTASNLSAGTYTVTVTDKNGCSVTASVTITQPPALSLAMSNTGEKCNGDANGTATVSVSGGTPGYTYAWAPSGGTGATDSNLAVGCYTVTVTDKNGCTATGSTCITQPPPLSAIISSTTSSCSICDGSAKVSVSGGTGPYTYSWNTVPVQTSDSATGLCVGKYTVTVTDAHGCTATAVATIIPTVKIVVTTSANTVSCDSSCDGVATANPTGGSAPYTYSWSTVPIQTNQTATGLCAGSYTVTVTDKNGCKNVDSVTFINPPKLTVTTTQTNVTCSGKCNGSATATGAGGTPPYTFLWTPGGQTTATINNLCVGNDTVTVTDANGCTATAVVTITDNGTLNDNPTVTEPTCGASNGSITLSPSGGTAPYTYTWAPAVSVTNIAVGLSAGTYTVTISDNAGCSQTFFVLLNNVSGPTVTSTGTNATCPTACDGSASVTVVSGVSPYTYLWNTGATTTSIAGLCPGVYVCSITDANGCVTNISDTVKKPVPISPNPSIQNIPCNGDNNGKITLATSGGTGPYSYSWSPNVSTSNAATGLSQGTYTVTISDNVGCDTVIDINITEPPALTVTITANNITCFGDSNGSATANVSGGTVPYIYSWSTGGVVPTIVNLGPGTYTLTVHDVNGCSATASVTITQPALLTGTIKPINVSCNLGSDGGAIVTTSGGTPQYTYTWSNGQTGDTLKNVSVGTYYLTITDSNGCSFFDSVQVIQPPPINITFTTVNNLCNSDCSGSAKANISGGTSPYTYSWNTVPVQTNQTATGLCAGSYVVTVTDANGCTANNTVTITQPPPLLANPTAKGTSCPSACDGSASASPTGGTAPYKYKWSNGATTSSISGLCGGTDTLVVTDKNGCSDTAIITIPIPTKLSISSSTSPSNCNTSDGSITVVASGGTGPYTYAWTPNVSTNNTATGLSAGIYTVQVTDSKGCDSVFTVILNNTGGPSSFSNTQANELCFGDSAGYINAIPNGGVLPYTYFWTNIPSPNGQGTDSIYNLSAGTYTLQVTDNSGCIQFDTVTVIQPSALADIGTALNATCAGVCTGSVSLSTSGGTAPYSYLWSNGATTTTVTGLCPGNDTVTITDANGCVLKQEFTIGQNISITVSTTSTGILCNGAGTGSATASATGGGGIYTYSWSPGGQTNQTATNLTAGTYTILVTDQNGCQGTDSVKIIQPLPLSVNLKNTPVTCNNACDGKSVANPSGGTPPYTNHWSNGSTADSIFNECSGTFIDTVTDANGCFAIDSVTFINPPVMSENSIVTNASCNTTNDGDITITVTGGIAPYTYSWSNGSTTQNLTNVLPGKYILTLTDSTGCTLIDTILLPSDTTVLAEAGNDTTFCENSATITLDGSKSVNSTSYEWFQLPGFVPLGNTVTVTIPTPPIGTTSYALITRDGACIDTDTIVVTITPPPVADAGPTKTIVIYTSTTIGGSPTGPAGSTYHWSPATGLGGDTTSANPVASPTTTTTYTVTVTGPSGCVSIDTVTVFVVPQIVIPDGFTPNGDGQNDTWVIKNIYMFPNAVVEVYNRWGEELFYSAGYKTPWDGTYNNKSLPVGTYYYIIDLHDPRFPKAYTGPVTIMR